MFIYHVYISVFLLVKTTRYNLTIIFITYSYFNEGIMLSGRVEIAELKNSGFKSVPRCYYVKALTSLLFHIATVYSDEPRGK